MTIHLVTEYLIALLGLLVGGGIAIALTAARGGTITRWDARVSLPLLVAALGAHIALITAVEPTRQLLFGLYALALLGVVGSALVGWSIWRIGGVVFPAGSMAAYFYFAIQVHEADYVGLLVKLVELAAIAAVLLPVFKRAGKRSQRIVT